MFFRYNGGDEAIFSRRVISGVIPAGLSQARRAEVMLLIATFFWGWTFPVVKDAIAVMPVFAFLFFRFTLAAVLMVVLGFKPTRAALRTGCILGFLLFLSFAFQTAGLFYTSAANCAFITGLNVVWIALLTSRQPRVWLAVAIAVAGLWLMAAPDKQFNIGDGLTVVASVFIAWHIILLNKLDGSASSGQLALVQFAMVGLLSLAVSLAVEENQLAAGWNGSLIFALVITVLGATIFSFWVQTHYQRFTTPVRASLIFIMEPVFAAIFSVLFYGEVLQAAVVVGAGLLLCAMLLTVGSGKKSLTLSG